MTDTKAVIISDLSYGDAGKGTLTHYLASEMDVHTVVRYNGGAQAAHNVITAEGIHHTFAQFGSASFVGARTFLSQYMLVDPISLFSEGNHLRALGLSDIYSLLAVDYRALLTSPFQQAINRLREIARNNDRHGSCGMGIGETMSDALKLKEDSVIMGDLRNEKLLRRKLKHLRDFKVADYSDLKDGLPKTPFVSSEVNKLFDDKFFESIIEAYLIFAEMIQITEDEFVEALFKKPGTIVFEGAQGVLLDEWHGFHPYTTWSTTTPLNAHNLLQSNGFEGNVTTLGLLRAYGSRHGAGPFVSEDPELSTRVLDYHNGFNDWQRDFRVGYFDLLTSAYALEASEDVDYLVITNLDRMVEIPDWKICTGYTYPDHPDNSSGFFEIENGLVSRLIPDWKQDLQRQGRLTELVSQCAPVYQELPHNEDGYLDYIEEALGVAIAITGHGPTEKDKKQRITF